MGSSETRVVDDPQFQLVNHSAGAGRLPGLDGLRAIAVLLVVLMHFCPSSASGSLWDKVVDNGGFGVEVFFVLSGFLITHLLLREEKAAGRISIRLFYARRALRILPPLVLYLAFLYLACMAGAIEVPITDLFAGLLFCRNYVGTSLETGHLWTLAIEEQFYLLWPITLVLIKSVRFRLLFTAGFVCLSPFWRHLTIRLASDPSAINQLRTDLRIEPLAIGALLALLLSIPLARGFLTRPFIRGLWIAALAMVFLCAVLLTNTLDVPIMRAFTPTLSWVCVAAIINCSIHDPTDWLTSMLELRPLVWLGTLSYSLYLWQQPFAPYVGGGASPAWFRESPINLLFAFSLAVFSFYCVERPIFSLRSRLRQESLP